MAGILHLAFALYPFDLTFAPLALDTWFMPNSREGGIVVMAMCMAWGPFRAALERQMR